MVRAIAPVTVFLVFFIDCMAKWDVEVPDWRLLGEAEPAEVTHPLYLHCPTKSKKELLPGSKIYLRGGLCHPIPLVGTPKSAHCALARSFASGRRSRPPLFADLISPRLLPDPIYDDRICDSEPMNYQPHPAFERLRKRIAESSELLRPWQGVAYRVTTLDYPSPKSILLGQGSFLHGGRWNARGSFRAVYGSTVDTVAVAESRATADYARIPLPFATPRLLVAIELALQPVLDLTRASIRERLGITSDELRAEDWRKVQEEGRESFTQAIGRALFSNGGEGLLVPSARVAEGLNVVYFPENHGSASRVRVLESEKLDRIRLA